MKSNGSFSQRNGFDTIEAIPITIRNDAAHELRGGLQVGYNLGLNPSDIREIIL